MSAIRRPTVMLIGRFGIGKSAAAVEAFGSALDRVMYVSLENNAHAPIFNPRHNPNRLRPVVKMCYDAVTAYDQVLAVLPEFEAGMASGRFVGIIIDKVNQLVGRRVRQLKGDRDEFKDHGKAWAKIADNIGFIYDRIMATNAVVFSIADEVEPGWFERNGRSEFKPGGLDMTGQLRKKLAAVHDLCVRIDVAPNPETSEPERVLRRNELDGSWRLKDRWDVIEDGERLDMASVCRRIVERQRALLEGE
jgi:hypothetical protein